mgnify:CR=1 FL=1
MFFKNIKRFKLGEICDEKIFENIVCIGDSLTAGFTNKNGTTFGSNSARPTKRNWPGYLGQRLNKEITNLTNSIHDF